MNLIRSIGKRIARWVNRVDTFGEWMTLTLCILVLGYICYHVSIGIANMDVLEVSRTVSWGLLTIIGTIPSKTLWAAIIMIFWVTLNLMVFRILKILRMWTVRKTFRGIFMFMHGITSTIMSITRDSDTLPVFIRMRDSIEKRIQRSKILKMVIIPVAIIAFTITDVRKTRRVEIIGRDMKILGDEMTLILNEQDKAPFERVADRLIMSTTSEVPTAVVVLVGWLSGESVNLECSTSRNDDERYINKDDSDDDS